MKAAWEKIRERFGSSFFFKVGILTLPGGLILGAVAFIAGFDLGLMTNPQYWAGLLFVIGYISVSVGTTLWGWFADPLE